MANKIRLGMVGANIRANWASDSHYPALLASPLGVKKIELGDKGGRFTFIPEPDIDPMKLITLIQTKPAEFKFDGQERLKIEKRLKDFPAREAFVKELLTHLSS